MGSMRFNPETEVGVNGFELNYETPVRCPIRSFQFDLRVHLVWK